MTEARNTLFGTTTRYNNIEVASWPALNWPHMHLWDRSGVGPHIFQDLSCFFLFHSTSYYHISPPIPSPFPTFPTTPLCCMKEGCAHLPQLKSHMMGAAWSVSLFANGVGMMFTLWLLDDQSKSNMCHQNMQGQHFWWITFTLVRFSLVSEILLWCPLFLRYPHP